MRSRLALLLAPALCLAGCYVGGLPPPATLAPLTHLPPSGGLAETGKVSATVGIATDGVSFPTDEGYVAFDGEGSASFWVDPSYDLTITTNGYMGAVTGNYLLLTGPVRLGILHGIGLSVAGSGGDTLAFGEATLGLDLQLHAGSGAVLIGGQFTYSTATILGGPDANGGIGVQPFGYAGVNVGWTGRVGALQLGPGLSVARRMPLNPSNAPADWMAALTFTVSAPIPGGR